MTTQPNASDVEKAQKIIEMVMLNMDDLYSCRKEIAEALSEVRAEEQKKHDETIALLAKERDAFGKRETELMQKYGKLVEALKLDQQLERFECSHNAEQRCKCGLDERKLYAKYREVREEALKSIASGSEGKE